MRHSKKELSEIEADHKYWEEFGSAIGWRLRGFTSRIHAEFETGRKMVYLPGFNITGAERDAIMTALAKARKFPNQKT